MHLNTVPDTISTDLATYYTFSALEEIRDEGSCLKSLEMASELDFASDVLQKCIWASLRAEDSLYPGTKINTQTRALMTTIKLPTRLFYDDADAAINCRKYLKSTFDKAYEELEEGFENLKYTNDRAELATCFQNQSTTFKKLSLVFKMLKYAPEISYMQDFVEKTEGEHRAFFSTADRLAYSFEDFKKKVRPSLNIRNTLKFYKDYNLLYPRILLGRQAEVGYDKINRLINIYLLKETIKNLDVHVKDGIVTLESEHFTFKLTLCGNVKSPEWKLFDINRENKIPFLVNLPSKIEKLDLFVGLYSSLEKAKKIYSVFVGNKFFKGLVKGNLKNFSIEYISVFRVQVKKEDVVGTFIYRDKTEYLFGDMVKEYEAKIEEILQQVDKRARFSIEDRISIEELSFNTLTELKEYLYGEKEQEVFYSLFSSFKHIKNYKRDEFGTRNVFIRMENRFICIKLNEVKEIDGSDYLEVEVFVGRVLENNYLYYSNLLFYYGGYLFLTNARGCSGEGETCKEGKINLVPAGDLKLFFDKKVDFIPIFFELLLCNSRFRITLGNEMQVWLEEKSFKVRRGNGLIRINEYIVGDLENIKGFFEFHKLVEELEGVKDIKYTKKNEIFYYEFRKVAFNLSFVNKKVVMSDNKCFAKLMDRDAFAGFMENLYYMYLFSMYPDFICRDYVIFDFRMVFRDQVVLKTKDKDTFLVKKTYSTTSNFRLKSFNQYYFECKAEDSDFFEALRSLYLKERFLRLGNALMQSFDVKVKEFAISLVSKEHITFILAENKFYAEVNGQQMREDLLETFANTFYTDECFVVSFIRMIGEVSG